ncbi:MAG TPA: saccharopine dehydrogenase NADP-binding domain-containing protein [Asticcacaulis sp.]|nr:saccharopine dehydrogenase NADP-binding domain-containing protein [Asticcacaulis sp.]
MPDDAPKREVLILGGYGNFGKRIAHGLTRHGVPVIVAGRRLKKAQALCRKLPKGLARAAQIDIHLDFLGQLRKEKPSVVIHTCGPYQGADYSVARACMQVGAHYIDLADGRGYVRDFKALNGEAQTAGITAISGASTVPGLSSAVLSHFKQEFASLDEMDFSISPGQKAERGLATTRSILSYAGKPMRPFAGHPKAYGWQDLRREDYPVMGKRWLANCDIPDLDLLPRVYGVKSIRFGAGLEIGFLHVGLWMLAGLVRMGVPVALKPMAKPLLFVSNLFNLFGSDVGGMQVTLTGSDAGGKPIRRAWAIVAEGGDGPQIPCVPAILLAKRLHDNDPSLAKGAYACVGLVTLEDYLAELSRFKVRTFVA